MIEGWLWVVGGLLGLICGGWLLRELIRGLKMSTIETVKERVVIYVEGGVVQGVYVSEGILGVEVEIVDADNLDGLTRREIAGKVARAIRGLECVG